MQIVPEPAPRDNEIIIRVIATTAHIGNVRMSKADPFLVRVVSGLLKPTRLPILGTELAGEVASAGRDVRRLNQVTGSLHLPTLRSGRMLNISAFPKVALRARV